MLWEITEPEPKQLVPYLFFDHNLIVTCYEARTRYECPRLRLF